MRLREVGEHESRRAFVKEAGNAERRGRQIRKGVGTMEDYKGKVVFITGGTSGLGYAFA